MRALSVWQPWASLLISGIKAYETRHWQPPAALTGHRIAIHASKTEQGVHLFGLPGPLLQLQWEASMRLKREHAALADYPFGALLGTAVLSFVIPTDSAVGAEVLAGEKALGDWSPGRFAWRFIDHRIFPKPIPYRGSQGFFNVSEDLLP